MDIMTKNTFDLRVKYGFLKPKDADEILKTATNWLLNNLYLPALDLKQPWLTDTEKITRLGIDGEPINWGDLSCCGVKILKDGSFEIVIEEAAPGACPGLCGYIVKYLIAWGWDVSVSTEW